MDVLASVGVNLVFFALSLGLMQFALWKRKSGGLFSALPLGLLPALVLAVAQFWSLQQVDLPEVKAERAQWADLVHSKAIEQLPGKDQAADRAQMETLWTASLEAEPAGLLVLIMVVLAPLAAYLRRRQAKRGLAADPGPLAFWSAPWGLVWLVVAPAFIMAASRSGWLSAPAWLDHLALNALTLGTVIFLFQGLVVVAVKESRWFRDPRTRGMAILGLLGLVIGFMFTDRLGLLQMFGLMLLLIGLLEPWVDLRRLKAQVPQGGA